MSHVENTNKTVGNQTEITDLSESGYELSEEHLHLLAGGSTEYRP
jgi:hypothetical protein